MSECQKGKGYMNNEKKQNIENGTTIHFYYTNTHLHQPSDFVAIHQTMGWLTTTPHPVWEKNTCMRHLSKCIIFATLAKYSDVRCNEVSASRACNPLEFLFGLSAVCAVHPLPVPPFQILPFSFFCRPIRVGARHNGYGGCHSPSDLTAPGLCDH